MTRDSENESRRSKQGSSSSKNLSSPVGHRRLSIEALGSSSHPVGAPLDPSWSSSKKEIVSELLKLRLRHTQAIAQLILWTKQQRIDLVLGEGYVMLDRRFHLSDGNIAKGQDAVHLRTGNHYRGLAMDCLLYIDGTYITNGDHPTWRRIGEKWETLDTLARWGGHFGDANHLSFIYGGIR